MLFLSELMQEPSLGMTALWCPNPEHILNGAVVSEHTQPALFLQGNEYLLTASAGGAKSAANWDKYVAQLKNRKVAAIGVGLGQQLPAVPAELLAACRKWGMNLFELKDTGTFALISKKIATLKKDNERQGQMRLFNLQQALVKATTQANPLPVLLKTLAQSLSAHIGLYTGTGREIFQASPSNAANKFIQVLRELPPFNPHLDSWKEEREKYTLLGQKITGESGRNYYLQAVFPQPPATWQTTAISQAVLMIGAVLLHQFRLRANQYQLLEQAWELLLSGEEKAGGILLEIAYPQSRTLRGEYSAVCVSGESAELMSYRELVLTQDYSVTSPIPLRLFPQKLELFVPVGALPLTLSHLGKGEYCSLRAGVGGSYALNKLPLSRKEAQAALPHADEEEPVRWWKQIAAQGFFAVFSEAELSSYAHNLLAPIAADPELLQVLEIFINSNGNRLEVAKQMNLHRNTVTGRIQKLQRALKMNLDEPGTRAQLWIALKYQDREA